MTDINTIKIRLTIIMFTLCGFVGFAVGRLMDMGSKLDRIEQQCHEAR